MPFFSVIIPTYNRAALIAPTIESVLGQQFTDFELIIVDDGSTDNTREHIAGYDDSRIRYIYQENGERGKARNTGTKAAKGDYIFFLDSDDLIYPGHLQHAYIQLQQLDHPEFFHIRYELVTGNEKETVPSLSAETIGQKIKLQNQFACQFFLKNSVAIAFPFCENRQLKIGEDWEVILKIGQRYPLHFSNEVHAAIVNHGERSMEVADAATILTSRDLLIERLGQDEKITPDILKNITVEFTFLASLSESIANRKKSAFGFWWKAFKQRPSILFRRRSLAIAKKIMLNGKA